MKRHFLTRLVALMLACCMLLSNGISVSASAFAEKSQTNTAVTNSVTYEANDNSLHQGEFNEGVVLVKVKDSFRKSDLGELDFTSAEPLYNGSKWHVVTLADKEKTEEAVQYLTGLSSFDAVDYDYIMKVTADMASVDVSGNPNYESQNNLNVHKIPYGWTQNGKYPGGSLDVVVAVIDTGVDYNHEDLNNNIWINSAEIPNNGRDDDGNGYIDDVYGWDFVGNDKDPMDDNGHGTHVAGIIAAENNKKGGVGVAYGCKVMVLKAGNASGYFNNTDIAEAIEYAYMNGASVINMSFGGYSMSITVEEALKNAYDSCILVAAAGNDKVCNQPLCACGGSPMFPAAHPYVIGVMSVNGSGSTKSSFSNYDHCPYNEYEYEVYAVGESVYSCWPNNKYANLSGTSMAAPTVAGIAALLRSMFSDREVYSTKYIQSQIVNSGIISPDGWHSVVDVYNALNKAPTPNVSLYSYYFDDSASISAGNNGNGVIDAGETVRIYISLYNRGGVASNISVSIDSMRNNDPSITDPYFTFVNTNINLSDIGTYSVREAYSDEYFEVIVAPDCPNDYLTNFNIRFTYKNGIDESDNSNYSGAGTVQFNISAGCHLSGLISEDTVFKSDKLYIIGDGLVIAEGVTVTFEAGCKIQFYDDREYYDSPTIVNYGTLKFEGTKDNPITLFPNERHVEFGYAIQNRGTVLVNYIHATNLVMNNEVHNTTIDVRNSSLRQNCDVNGFIYCYAQGSTQWSVSPLIKWPNLHMDLNDLNCCVYSLKDSYVEILSWDYNGYERVSSIENCMLVKVPFFTNEIGSLWHWNCYDHGRGTDVTIATSLIGNVIYSKAPSYVYNYNLVDVFSKVENNLFISDSNLPSSLLYINFANPWLVSNNSFSETYQQYASQVIKDYYDSTGNPVIDVYSSFADATKLWPHVVNVELFDKNGNPTTTVGKEEIKVRVTFNRPMDISKDTYLTFGTIEPYADYRINGKYISSTVWEGTYTLKAQIENGQNYLKVENACTAEDQTKKVFGEYQLHEFTIDTTVAMSSSIVANSTSKGIELSWMQDDYDTLMGYNIYRAESENGDYVKINPAVVLDAYSTYTDADVEAGKTYWYTFTTVLSDFTESLPAGRVSAVAQDAVPPTITHTPITNGYLNRNINIYCNASDNVAVTSVTLYFRAIGETQWHTRNMSKAGDRYGATIYGSETTLAGFEYYIVASDGNGNGFCGGVNDAFRVNITHASEDHTFGGDWFANEDGHWQTCTVCGEKGAVKAHKPGAAATETTPQVCTECGFVLKAAFGHTHEYSTTYNGNELMHWYECPCGAKTSVGDHVFDNACDPDCNTCGYTIARSHLYDNDCDPRCNKCAETRETEHVFDDGVVTKKPTTTKYGEMTYTCTICGAEKYEDIDMLPKEEEKKPVEEEKPKGGCYIATCVYGSYDCSEVWTLRRFRDDTLASTWLGRTFVHTYYAISPTLVDWFGDDAWFRTAWRTVLDVFVDVLNWFGVEDTAYEDKIW